jgi:hypothetical protein
MDGLLTSAVTEDGDDATSCLVNMITPSPFFEQIQLILLGGVTLGGFNFVDVFELHQRTERPVMVVVRKFPDGDSIKKALANVPDHVRKREMLRHTPTLQQVNGLWVQAVGLSNEEAAASLVASTLHGHFPEPLRVAHLIAGGVTRGRSKGGA